LVVDVLRRGGSPLLSVGVKIITGNATQATSVTNDLSVLGPSDSTVGLATTMNALLATAGETGVSVSGVGVGTVTQTNVAPDNGSTASSEEDTILGMSTLIVACIAGGVALLTLVSVGLCIYTDCNQQSIFGGRDKLTDVNLTGMGAGGQRYRGRSESQVGLRMGPSATQAMSATMTVPPPPPPPPSMASPGAISRGGPGIGEIAYRNSEGNHFSKPARKEFQDAEGDWF